MSDTGGRRRGGIFDDLAGVAGGAFSALAGVRGEVEAAARAQVDAMVQRLDLVKREDLDAAMELARRAREAQEALESRVAALEARLAGMTTPAPASATPPTPVAPTPVAPTPVAPTSAAPAMAAAPATPAATVAVEERTEATPDGVGNGSRPD
ncbi:accessory factor UbiK family protein [Roseicella sp. DB1501]|uniref:accessory factor UbiK family protein n=1 Tax=Roseicella sp. DB1501 TaxID=2730925 RepID=UPI0014925487|nr:accessory factor UbiK family protein [Roseicella sp. DB1501]NOG72913.1 accessory factor UbiK family protein [Roseicella sp. DB1501]